MARTVPLARSSSSDSNGRATTERGGGREQTKASDDLDPVDDLLAQVEQIHRERRAGSASCQHVVPDGHVPLTRDLKHQVVGREAHDARRGRARPRPGGRSSWRVRCPASHYEPINPYGTLDFDVANVASVHGGYSAAPNSR